MTIEASDRGEGPEDSTASIWTHDGSASSFRCYDDDDRDLAACVERRAGGEEEVWIWLVWKPGIGPAVERGESATRWGAMAAADGALARFA
jgi:hypothetical protein